MLITKGSFENWRLVCVRLKRRLTISFLVVFATTLSLTLVLGSCTSQQSLNATSNTNNSAATSTHVIRIGHQPFGTLLYLKARGTLEQRLAPLGFSVQWMEFSAGRAILAAMGEGKIDLGYAGVVPPIFAQANGVPFVYVANDPAVPESMGILVAQDSPIRTLSDLKGKKITATKASAGQYFLVQALIKAGLTLDDVELVDLPPPEGQVAFKEGKVDAWVGWSPFLIELQESSPVRLLMNAEGLMNDTNFYLATRSFANSHDEIVKIAIAQAQQVGTWATNHPEEAAKILSANKSLNPLIALKITQSRRYKALPIQDRAIEEQQRVAETFFRLGLLPKRIWVEDAMWKGKLSH
ncbi:MAG TPA: sulfonate ABC transporter substrate-binding protein [Coleofasciculaceae cyanobacterium]